MIRVVHHAPLGRQEIVIAAAPARIIAANFRTCFIDRAAALISIEEMTNLTEMLVFLPSHCIGRAPVGVFLGEFLLCLLVAKAEILRQALQITLCQLDDGIGTTIAGTFRTIIHEHRFASYAFPIAWFCLHASTPSRLATRARYARWVARRERQILLRRVALSFVGFVLATPAEQTRRSRYVRGRWPRPKRAPDLPFPMRRLR